MSQSATPPMNRVIGDLGIRYQSGAIKVELRLPWYRSLPLSTVEIEAVEIDGEPIQPARLSFELEGRRYALSEMEEQTGHVWYVLDSGWLNIDVADLRPGPHELSIVLSTYPPYIHGLKRPLRDRQSFTIAEDHADV